MSNPNTNNTTQKALALGTVSGTVTLDASVAQTWSATLSANTVFNFTKIPTAGNLFEPQILVSQNNTGGYTASFTYASNTIAPQWDGTPVTVAAAANALTVFNLQTIDGGVTFFGRSTSGVTTTSANTWTQLQTFAASINLPAVSAGTTTYGSTIVANPITDTMVQAVTGVAPSGNGMLVLDTTTRSIAVRIATNSWYHLSTRETGGGSTGVWNYGINSLNDGANRNNLSFFAGQYVNTAGSTGDAQAMVAIRTDASGLPYVGLGPGSFSTDVGFKRTATGMVQTIGRWTAASGAPFQTVTKVGGFVDADVTAGTVADGVFGVDTTSATMQYRANGSWYSATQIREQDAIAAQGWQAWSYDSMLATSNASLVAGTLYVCRVAISKGSSYSQMGVGLYSAGATFTTGQTFIGLYNILGNLIIDSADQGTSTGFGYGAASSGYVRLMPFTSAQTLTPGQVVYAAVLVNATTMPKLAVPNGAGLSQPYQIGNNGTAGANRRYGIAGTGLTALPSTITPTALTASALYPWIGLI